MNFWQAVVMSAYVLAFASFVWDVERARGTEKVQTIDGLEPVNRRLMDKLVLRQM